jgi:hypothetical protein
MGYAPGGAVDLIDEPFNDDEVSQLSNENLLSLLSSSDEPSMQEQFAEYQNILNGIYPERRPASGYDLASAIGKGLLAQQQEKMPSIGRGIGIGFSEFNKLQKEIEEKQREEKQKRDLTALGLVTKKKSEVAGRGQAFYRTKDGVYREYSFPDGVYYIGPKGKLPLSDFNTLYPDRELTSSTELESKLPTYEQFVKLKDKAINDELSLRQIERYSESVKTLTDLEKGGATGFGLLALEFSRGMKTLFGDYKKITPAEVAELLAKGQLQGLIGQFRTSVVGPGVMTEQDAARIINYFGGDIGMLTNPVAIASALKNIYQDKYQAYESSVESYNEVPRVSIFKNFKKLDKKDLDLSIFDVEDMGIPPNAKLIETMADGSLKYHDSMTSTTYILDPNGGIIEKQEQLPNIGGEAGSGIILDVDNPT